MIHMNQEPAMTEQQPFPPMTATPQQLAPAPAPQPEPEPQHQAVPGEAAAAQEAEVALEASGDYVVAPLCGVPVRVLMAPKWRSSHMRMLRNGDTDGFMEAILEDAGVDVYYEKDPDQEQFEEFLTEASDASKEALGKSGGRSRSSRTTRRR